jgi:pyruvate formate lyase activating enzyme
MDPTDTLTGIVFNIQRFCTHDGPGIRTTVFVKGCPLRCQWCHNPEGLDRQPEIALDMRKCIGCRACLENCEHGGHEIGPEGEHLYHVEPCIRCGSCSEGCFAGAIEMLGEEKTPQDVLDVVLRDKPFYENSKGGVTLSGGEPMYQPEFSRVILERCREENIHTVVETSSATGWSIMETFLPLVDMWLCDVKQVDPKRHRELTGSDNKAILENVRNLCASGAHITIRLPLIPSLNDDEDSLEALGAYYKEIQPKGGLQLMPYHRLGTDKYDRVHKEYGLLELEEATDDHVRAAAKILKDSGVDHVFCDRIPDL